MKNSLKIAFFGTPVFAAIVLEQLKENSILPSLIISSPDKPKGRKLLITPPEAKVWGNENGVDTLQPEKLKDEEFLGELKNTDWDLFIIASYGKIIPKEILDMPKYGVLNIHPSLLPKFRGASPIQSVLLSDDKKTGITIMLVDEEMDHGPIVAQATMELEGWPIKASLLKEILATEGGKLLSEIIPKWIKGEITPEEQNHSKATYTKKIEKEDGLIDIQDDPYENFKKIMAFDEWPSTYFFAEKNGKKIRVKIADAQYSDDKLKITRVIPENKKEMDYKDFMRGL